LTLRSWRKGDIRRFWRNNLTSWIAFVLAAIIVVVLVLTTPL